MSKKKKSHFSKGGIVVKRYYKYGKQICESGVKESYSEFFSDSTDSLLLTSNYIFTTKNY